MNLAIEVAEDVQAEGGSSSSSSSSSDEEEVTKKDQEISSIQEKEHNMFSMIWFIESIIDSYTQIIPNMKTFYMEMYLELCICCWITLLSIYNTELGKLAVGDYLSLTLAGIFGLVIFILPIYILCRFEKLRDD